MAYRTRLIEIGKILGLVQKELATRNAEMSIQKENLDTREATLIPAEGWPGKNEAERKASQAKALVTNEAYQLHVANIASLKRETAALLGDEAMLEAERRSLEYAVRDRLCDLLSVGEEEGGDIDAVQNVRQIDSVSNLVQPEEHATTPVLVKLDTPIPDAVKALFPEGTPIHTLDIVDGPAAPEDRLEAIRKASDAAPDSASFFESLPDPKPEASPVPPKAPPKKNIDRSVEHPETNMPLAARPAAQATPHAKTPDEILAELGF
jgi:hypothetical protein